KGCIHNSCHLDHIGGLPYLIDKLGYPKIYVRRFGEMMIRRRQTEFPNLKPLDIVTVGDDEEQYTLGDFKVRTFGISHAIPDSMGVILGTPYGNIVVIKDVRVSHVDGVVT